MISFIVIGRNEGRHLGKCLLSIRNACKTNDISSYSVIYVDSNSSDDSIKIAEMNQADCIIKLTSIWNAAIARNIGATCAEGDVLCFLDGDMELDPGFIKLILNQNGTLRYDLVSGDLVHHYYDESGDMIGKKREFSGIQKIVQKPITGGSFWTRKDIYFSVGGMDNRFKRGADPEFGIRLAKRGHLLTFIPSVHVIHHTEVISNQKLRGILRGNWFYGKALFYKFNLFNKYNFLRMMRNDSSLLVLAVCVLLSLFVSPWTLLIYLSFVLLRTRFAISKEKFMDTFTMMLRDVLVLSTMIFAYKRRIDTKTIPYEVIREAQISVFNVSPKEE